MRYNQFFLPTVCSVTLVHAVEIENPMTPFNSALENPLTLEPFGTAVDVVIVAVAAVVIVVSDGSNSC